LIECSSSRLRSLRYPLLSLAVIGLFGSTQTPASSARSSWERRLLGNQICVNRPPIENSSFLVPNARIVHMGTPYGQFQAPAGAVRGRPHGKTVTPAIVMRTTGRRVPE